MYSNGMHKWILFDFGSMGRIMRFDTEYMYSVVRPPHEPAQVAGHILSYVECDGKELFL